MAERQAVFAEIMQLMADKVITPYSGALWGTLCGGVVGEQVAPDQCSA